jgi:UDP-glucose 4-epimerase
MTTALVTGAAGFLGSHVADHLLAMGLRVVALDDLSGGFLENVPRGCQWRQGSIEDQGLLSELFRQHRFNCVFHFAAYAAEGLSHFIRHFNYRINVLGSINLINAAVNHGVEQFVFTSSAAVYGETDRPMDERDVPRPVDPYGIAKLAVEQDLRAATAMFGIRHVIFRPHNVYGKRQNLVDPFRNVIGIFMRQVLAGEPCTIFGDGTQTREFSHIDDVAPVIAGSIRNAEAQNETFNVGVNETCSVRALAHMIQAALNRDVGISYLPARQEAKSVLCSHKKADRVFDHTQVITLSDGIRRMANWARRHNLQHRLDRPRAEIAKRVPSSWMRELGPVDT